MSFAQLLQPGEEDWRDIYLETCTSKVGTFRSLVVTGPMVFTDIITPSVRSPLNTDLVLDAQGTGAIKINTIQSRGIRFGTDTGTNVTDQVVFAPGGDIAQNCLIMGVINRSGVNDFIPFIGAQIPSVSWQTLRLNHAGGSVIFSGDITQANSVYNPGNVYRNVIVGDTNVFGGSLYVGSSPFVDSIRNITNCPSISGILVPAVGGTFAKLSDIMTPSFLHLYYDSYPFNAYIAGQVIAIGTSVSNSSGMSVASNEISVPAVLGKYMVNLSVPVYRESYISLYDGNNVEIPGTRLIGGNPTLDAENVMLSGRFIITQPALNKFTLRSAGNSWIGKATSGLNAVTLHITVQRIL